MKNQSVRQNIENLLDIMTTLRDPQRGCPWDRAQSFSSIAPYTIEEAYEVADAIERGTPAELVDELGDLLFQVVFHAQIARDRGLFSFADVVEAICSKLTRRHPHVFGEATIDSAAEQSVAWEAIKRTERRQASPAGILDDVPVALPALTRAAKLGRRASAVGFDWATPEPVRAKVDEELGELDEAIASGERGRTMAEMGDMLFALVNLCRHLDLDPEACLREANGRFASRFGRVEQAVAASGSGWEEFDLTELDRFWDEAKRAEDAP
jgi:nucleoside triphosphate diphosphatase